MKTTGCPNILYPLCLWQFSHLPDHLKLKAMTFSNCPVHADFETVLDFIPSCKFIWDIEQTVKGSQNKSWQNDYIKCTYLSNVEQLCMANTLWFLHFSIVCLIKGPRLKFKGTLKSPKINHRAHCVQKRCLMTNSGL